MKWMIRKTVLTPLSSIIPKLRKTVKEVISLRPTNRWQIIFHTSQSYIRGGGGGVDFYVVFCNSPHLNLLDPYIYIRQQPFIYLTVNLIVIHFTVSSCRHFFCIYFLKIRPVFIHNFMTFRYNPEIGLLS